MGYTESEQKVLDILGKADFRHVSKDDVVGYVSMLQHLKPEIASKIIEQYPQLVKLIADVLDDNRKSIDKVIDSNDKSLMGCYGLLERVQADLSKCLDKDISEGEREKILDREMEIARMANENNVKHNDGNWKIIGLGSFVAILAVGIGTAALGGKFNIKLPKR